MEGGAIMDNTTLGKGGGVYIGKSASFRKTGGVIYGKNAPDGNKNTAIASGWTRFLGHAVSIDTGEFPVFKFRDTTVKKYEKLTYTGTQSGDGVFGKGERWHDQYTLFRRNLFVGVISALFLGFFAFVILRKKVSIETTPKGKPLALIEAEALLTEREKDVLHLLLAGKTAKHISLELECSVSNINKLSEKIYRKLNVNSYSELLVKFKD
jgi:DNA-binding CsgD family transcriptional regulator